MSQPIIQYDFPTGGPDPFDVSAKGNCFVFANGYSRLSDDPETFTHTELEKHIPMGYKTIVICRRLALISPDGGIIEFEKNDSQPNRQDDFSGQFFLTTDRIYPHFIPDWNREIQTSVIYKPGTTDAGSRSSVWDDPDASGQYGIQAAISRQCSILMSEVIDMISWH